MHLRHKAEQSTYYRRSRGPAFVRLALAVALVTAVVAPGLPAGAAPTWSVGASPSPVGPPSGFLRSVACPSIDRCFAVGFYWRDGTNLKTLIERWNGTSWSIMTSPNPAGATDSVLNGVSCPSTTSCYAVGNYLDASSFQKTLVEHWNGTSWSIMTSPNPAASADSLLNGVSCPSTTSCYAVGSYTDRPKHLVEHWNGTTWSIVPTPSPPGTTNSSLSGVSCPSTTSCYAVGYYFGSSTDTILVEHWNGARWSIMPSPNPTDAAYAVVNGVSCATPTRCFAVGVYFDGSDYKTLVQQLNGTRWSVVTSPNPPDATESVLNGVSCLSATRCYAVGTYTTGSTNKTLTARWNGTSWSVLASPTPIGAAYAVLSGVSCRPGSCYAVGNDDAYTLVEHWDSANWSIAALPSGGSQSQLGEVSCPSTTSCFAVGSYYDGSTDKTLVEHWNGTSWSIVPSPNVAGAAQSVLNGVSCTSTTSCYAVGNSFDGSTTTTLVERWNGTTWSIVTTPNPAGATGSNGSRLRGVSCPSATSCYAVGSYFEGTDSKTLVERWNGTSWSIVTSPNPTSGYSILNGVSCVSTTSCFAVGSAQGSSRTLVERWDGTSWSIVASPYPIGGGHLNSVKCLSATRCYAVGSGGTSEKTLVLRLDPSSPSWSMMTSPNPSGFSFLNGVSCASTTSCDAVGYSASSPLFSTGSTLVEHWNGTSWSIVTSPNPLGATSAALHGVSCPSTTTCFAAGTYRVNANQYTLIERYA